MRLESKVKINVRGRSFGGDKNLACIPVMSETKDALLEEIKFVVSLAPDIIEWRADYFDKVSDCSCVKEALYEMGPLLKNIPIIFTLRHICEGGAREYSQDVRLASIKAALETGYADIVDIEAANDKGFIEAVSATVRATGHKLIISYHDFKKTPAEKFIIDKLREEQALGADILKLAVMPKDFDDVLTLMRATYKARTKEGIEQPMITMSMGEEGKISRVIGDLYGSDMSFASGRSDSAPGQIPIADVKKLWDLLK